jgi:hypothetical protein
VHQHLVPVCRGPGERRKTRQRLDPPRAGIFKCQQLAVRGKGLQRLPAARQSSFLFIDSNLRIWTPPSSPALAAFRHCDAVSARDSE